MHVIVVGGGITGLTLALSLHAVGVSCRVYEAAREILKLGVGINLLPHAVRELTELQLQSALARVAVATREMAFFNRFGQFIYQEPRGRHAGYDWPQFSVHRGELHFVQLAAVHERLGADAVQLDHRCTGFTQDADGVTAHFVDRPCVRGDALIACDGIHSALRHQIFPDEGALVYTGINMWRGVSRWPPFLTGASMVQAGWLDVGKLVIYPISDTVDAEGRQLINWTAEIRSPRNVMADWNRAGRMEDFAPVFADWRFAWLDVPGLLAHSERVYEYPMVDRDPLPRWTHGRVTLVGDAAHPMYPRGGNGAGQGILDARTLAGCLARESDPLAALSAYETARLKTANDVVLANRSTPPDTILRLVHERTGDKPFERIEDVVSAEELRALMERYKHLAGFQRDALRERRSLVGR